MSRISCFLLFFIAAVLGQRFVSPGPSNNPASSNTVYAVGSKFFVAWEDANKTRPLSVVLFQLDKKGQLVYPFEYIEQRLTGKESVDWQVATTKDLDMSNQFLFNIFYDGDKKPVAVSSRFNITDNRKPSAASTTLSTSTTSSTSTNTGSPTNPPLSGATSDPPAGATSTDQPQPSDNSNSNSGSGLSTGAKIGIGVAVPLVALLGIGAGYFLNRCRSQRQQQQQQPAPALMWGDGQGQVPMGQKAPDGPVPTYELGYQDSGMNQNVPTGHELPHEPYNRPQELYSDPAHR